MSTKYQPILTNPIGQLSPELEQAEVVYKGGRFEIRKKGKREAVIHPGAVVILPIVDPTHILLIRNERFVVGETLWELPAGTLEPKEHPQQTAERELIEETGYSAGQIEFLFSFYTTPGFCNEKMFSYVAKELKFVGQNLEETEKITVEQLSWDEVHRMIKSGEIHDAKTLSTLYFFTLK